jgi:hypothetical protein
MKGLTICTCLLILGARATAAQELSRDDVAAIEQAAADYIVPTLPRGIIGLDLSSPNVGVIHQRDRARIDALTHRLGARIVRTDSILTCSGRPDTCRLAIDAIVRVGEPAVSAEGARIIVDVRRRSGFQRQPVTRGTKELLLSKKEGRWVVVGVGRRSAS